MEENRTYETEELEATENEEFEVPEDEKFDISEVELLVGCGIILGAALGLTAGTATRYFVIKSITKGFSKSTSGKNFLNFLSRYRGLYGSKSSRSNS